jgi:hypothetical protein
MGVLLHYANCFLIIQAIFMGNTLVEIPTCNLLVRMTRTRKMDALHKVFCHGVGGKRIQSKP